VHIPIDILQHILFIWLLASLVEICVLNTLNYTHKTIVGRIRLWFHIVFDCLG